MIPGTSLLWKIALAALGLLLLGALLQGYATPMMVIALDTLSYCF